MYGIPGKLVFDGFEVRFYPRTPLGFSSYGFSVSILQSFPRELNFSNEILRELIFLLVSLVKVGDRLLGGFGEEKKNKILKSLEYIGFPKPKFNEMEVVLTKDGIFADRFYEFKEFFERYFDYQDISRKLVSILENSFVKEEVKDGDENVGIIYYNGKSNGDIFLFVSQKFGYYVGIWTGTFKFIRRNVGGESGVWEYDSFPIGIKFLGNTLESSVYSIFPVAHPHIRDSTFVSYYCIDEIAKKKIDKLVSEYNSIKIGNLKEEFEKFFRGERSDLKRKVVLLGNILYVMRGIPTAPEGDSGYRTFVNDLENDENAWIRPRRLE